jgi:hypothetical protein
MNYLVIGCVLHLCMDPRAQAPPGRSQLAAAPPGLGDGHNHIAHASKAGSDDVALVVTEASRIFSGPNERHKGAASVGAKCGSQGSGGGACVGRQLRC